MSKERIEAQRLASQRARLETKRKEIVRCLPHLYGFPWYWWAKQFYDSTNRLNLLCAANQISKSSTQIRKCIDWATDKKKWSRLWPGKPDPTQFWYLYPSREIATMEFDTKWKEFLPKGAFKDDPVYGWKEHRNAKHEILHVTFNSGVILYFRTYGQDVQNLQSGTVYAIFCDEELPEELYSELRARLIATRGYFHMVFTATLNQDFWRRAIQGSGAEEIFPEAFKLQVSMFDCQVYLDGSPSPWTPERIKEEIDACKSQAEIDRRIRGLFVTEVGRKYGAFSADRHFIKPFAIPADFKYYGAVDIGGGGTSHPGAMVIIAVASDYRRGYVCRGWRGGEGEDTTAGDLLEKYRKLRGNLPITLQSFDQNAKDFGIIATRAGEAFNPSLKSHALGEDTINTLFKNNMLFIFDTDELRPLGNELSSLMKSTPKNKAKDDFADSLRYDVNSIPWDWSALVGDKTEEEIEAENAPRAMTTEEYLAWELEQRRGGSVKKNSELSWREMDEEIAYWNEEYGN